MSNVLFDIKVRHCRSHSNNPHKELVKILGAQQLTIQKKYSKFQEPAGLLSEIIFEGPG
jgi:hypothetical protein